LGCFSPDVVSYKCGLDLGVSLTIYTFAWICWMELAEKIDRPTEKVAPLFSGFPAAEEFSMLAMGAKQVSTGVEQTWIWPRL